MTTTEKIGRVVRRLRKAKGYSQERLANEAEMSTSHLRSIEHGCANPTIKTLDRLAQELDTDTTQIIGLAHME